MTHQTKTHTYKSNKQLSWESDVRFYQKSKEAIHRINNLIKSCSETETIVGLIKIVIRYKENLKRLEEKWPNKLK